MRPAKTAAKDTALAAALPGASVGWGEPPEDSPPAGAEVEAPPVGAGAELLP
jgi:hypothetical protein